MNELNKFEHLLFEFERRQVATKKLSEKSSAQPKYETLSISIELTKIINKIHLKVSQSLSSLGSIIINSDIENKQFHNLKFHFHFNGSKKVLARLVKKITDKEYKNIDFKETKLFQKKDQSNYWFLSMKIDLIKAEDYSPKPLTNSASSK